MTAPFNSSIYKTLGDDKIWVFVSTLIFVIACFIIALILQKLRLQADEAKKRVNFDAVMAEVSKMSYSSVDELINNLADKLEQEEQKKNKNSIEQNLEKKENEQGGQDLKSNEKHSFDSDAKQEKQDEKSINDDDN